jgi:homopolymeric O-antigen transport system permease protein
VDVATQVSSYSGVLEVGESSGGIAAPRRDDHAEQPSWTEIRPPKRFFEGIDAREVWAYREVALTLASRQVRVRYKQTVLGVGWVAIQPLVATVVFTLVFGRLAGLSSEGLPYAVFVLGGLVLWNYISASVSAATQCLVDGRELITKIFFPRLLVPVAACLAPLIDLTVGLAVLAVLMVVFGVAPGVGVILLPVWIVGAMVIAFAAGSLCAALNVCYRDVGNALGFIVQFWLFVSPVVFPSTAVHGIARTLLALNPVTGLVDGARWSLFGTPPPPAVDLLSLASALLLLVVGLLYFQRVQRRFADVV